MLKGIGSWLVLAGVVTACGGGETPSESGSTAFTAGSGGASGASGSAGASTSGGVSGSSTAVAGAGGSGAGTGGAAPFMGVGPDCAVFALPLMNAPRGLTVFHENAPTDDLLVAGTRVLTFKDDLFYVVENEIVKTIDLAGTIQELGPVPAGNPSLIDDQYYFTENSALDSGKLDHWIAPFAMPDQKTQLAQTVGGFLSTVAEGYQFWEVRGDEPAIWSAPLTGGAGAPLVPMGQPTGLVVSDGYLYWTDFATNMLDRVPVAGGTREPLAAVFFGGVMSAGFGAFYWSGPGGLSRWKPGGEEERLSSGGNRPFPVEGGAYFSAGGFSCYELYYLSLASVEPELLLSGFSGYTGIVAVTATQLYVHDKNAIYRLDR